MNKKSEKRQRLLLVFYGIGRNPESVNHNIKLINKKLNNFFEIKTAYALNKVNFINNPRTNEFNFVNQKEIKKTLSKMDIVFDIEQYMYEKKFKNFIKKHTNNKFKDPYNDNFKTLCNLYCQLSLLSDFFKEKFTKENYLFFTIRDDVIINNYFGLFEITKLLHGYPNYAYTTSYHWHKGINDRILLFNPFASKIFSNRLKKLKNSISRDNFFNSEKINMLALNSLGINIVSSPIKITRMRSNGKPRKEYFFLRIHRYKETFRVLKSIFLYLKLVFLNKIFSKNKSISSKHKP